MALYARHRADIDAVVIDMMMPDMDGPAAVRALRELNPAVRVIGVSGLVSGTESTGAGGVRAFLSKPYKAETLLRTLEEVLNESASPRVSESAGRGGGTR